jgi:hypothetical protein
MGSRTWLTHLADPTSEAGRAQLDSGMAVVAYTDPAEAGGTWIPLGVKGWRVGLGALLFAASLGSCRPVTPATTQPDGQLRDLALSSARVWLPPAVPIRDAHLGENPRSAGRPFSDDEEISCRFVAEIVGGATPKFKCELSDGEVVKVKYGRRNAEPHAEVVATRLLSTLGFGADRVYRVRRVKCFGCPAFPYVALRCLASINIPRLCFLGGPDYDEPVLIEPAVVERQMEGRHIETADGRGWAWFELDRIGSAGAGSTRSEVDALKLMAVFLAHWDNKAENQRLVCLPGGDRPDGTCSKPFALIQDVGATFGPAKLDLVNWKNTPVWADAARCRLSMESLPFEGGTFPEQPISEGGRLMLLGLLDQLSDAQLSDLFTRSGVIGMDTVNLHARNGSAWVSAFRDKVRQIREGGPCRSQ